MAAIHFLEDRGDAADLHELHGPAEALDGCQVAEAVFGSQVGHLEHLLERARAAHELPKNGPHRCRVQRPLVRFQHVLQDFLFARRREDFVALIVFDLADLRRQPRAGVDQFEDLQVESINLVAEMS